MPAISWKDNLTQNTLEEIYLIYLSLYKAKHISLRNKQLSFEAAAEGAHSWPIKSITLRALKHICDTGSCDGLRRAHKVDRHLRAETIFGCANHLEINKLFSEFFEKDEVVLALKEENRKKFIIDHDKTIKIEGTLFSRPGMKAFADKADLSWAKEKFEEVKHLYSLLEK